MLECLILYVECRAQIVGHFVADVWSKQLDEYSSELQIRTLDMPLYIK